MLGIDLVGLAREACSMLVHELRETAPESDPRHINATPSPAPARAVLPCGPQARRSRAECLESDPAGSHGRSSIAECIKGVFGGGVDVEELLQTGGRQCAAHGSVQPGECEVGAVLTRLLTGGHQCGQP